jgi:hypothetical protein
MFFVIPIKITDITELSDDALNKSGRFDLVCGGNFAPSRGLRPVCVGVVSVLPPLGEASVSARDAAKCTRRRHRVANSKVLTSKPSPPLPSPHPGHHNPLLAVLDKRRAPFEVLATHGPVRIVAHLLDKTAAPIEMDVDVGAPGEWRVVR